MSLLNETRAMAALDKKLESLGHRDLELSVRVLLASLAQRGEWKSIAAFEAAVDRCLLGNDPADPAEEVDDAF